MAGEEEKIGAAGEENAVPEFSTALHEEKVKIDGESYVLVELFGDGKDAYRDNEIKKMRVENGKVVGITVKGTQASLIGLCLHKENEDGRRTPVPVEKIRKWPPHVIEPLYKRCRKMNLFDDVDMEAVKND